MVRYHPMVPIGTMVGTVRSWHRRVLFFAFLSLLGEGFESNNVNVSSGARATHDLAVRARPRVEGPEVCPPIAARSESRWA